MRILFMVIYLGTSYNIMLKIKPKANTLNSPPPNTFSWNTVAAADCITKVIVVAYCTTKMMIRHRIEEPFELGDEAHIMDGVIIDWKSYLK